MPSLVSTHPLSSRVWSPLGNPPFRKTVDIVIPCYNYARYLHGCVQSVLSQEGVEVRVLILDDASTDGTASLGRELAATHGAVEFCRHAVNRGHIATYNEGLIDWSTADYTVLLSADDLLAPGSLRRAVDVMESDRTIGMVYGRAVHFVEQAPLSAPIPATYRYTKHSGSAWLERRCRAGYNVITSPEVVVRGEVQRSVGGYRPALPHTGDLEMWLRIAAVADVAYIHSIPQAFYRVHQASMQRTTFSSSVVDFIHRKAAFDSFFEHVADTRHERSGMKKLAGRALAREALWDLCRAYDHNRVQPVQQEELQIFALSAYPDAAELKEYAALLRRRRLGAKVCHRTQLFLAPAVVHWAKRWWQKRRWQNDGI